MASELMKAKHVYNDQSLWFPSLNFKISILCSLAEGWRRLARREATVNQERQASTDSSVCAPSRKYNIRPWSTICIHTHHNIRESLQTEVGNAKNSRPCLLFYNSDPSIDLNRIRSHIEIRSWIRIRIETKIHNTVCNTANK